MSLIGIKVPRPFTQSASILLALIASSVLSVPASAAIESQSLQVRGPGLELSGREISVKVAVTNVSPDPTITPEAIARISIGSRTIRFNGDSDSVTTCKASLPKNGDAADCPKSSRVGGGTITAILGQPGQAVDTFGLLSFVQGRFKLFNYAHPRGKPARMIVVITATKPFKGTSINLVAPVSRDGTVTINIPKLRSLPPLIRRSYPAGTKLVLSKFSANIVAPRRKRAKPFISLRRPGRVDAKIEVVSGP